MIKRFAILILFFCTMPDILYAACTADMQDCPENYYNSQTCQLGMMGGLGYECKSCESIGDFHRSTGGIVTIEDCYVGVSCNDPHDGWICKLFYDGRNFCTQGNSNILRPAHVEYKSYITNDGTGTFSVPECFDNTRNCSEFDLDSGGNLEQLSIDYAGTQGLVAWVKNMQQGIAVWDTSTYKWDVDENCKLSQSATSIKRGNVSKNCNGYIFRMGAEIVGSASLGFKIKYTGEDLYYCSYCKPGKTPEILNLSDTSSYYACMFWNIGGGNNGNYKVCSCKDTDENFYSTGCDLPNYPWTTQPDVPAACHTQCPGGTTTNSVTGATNVNQCVPDGTEYCDSIGCFTLGSGSCY